MSIANFYAIYLDKWNAKEFGPKPTTQQIDTINKLGPRHGKQCFANAMYLRDCGATNDQIVKVIGKPQRNKKDELVKLGLVEQKLLPKVGDHMVYKIVLTPKGAAMVKAASKPVTKQAKKPAAKKPVVKKPVVVPAEAPQISA